MDRASRLYFFLCGALSVTTSINCLSVECAPGDTRCGAALAGFLNVAGANAAASFDSGLTSGGSHTCVIVGDGAVRCWGAAFNGNLGYGNTTSIGDDETPSSAGDVDVGGRVTQLSAGSAHVCALLDTGAVRCWGFASGGRLGYANGNDIGDNETPASAGDVNVGGTVRQIAAGFNHTCALLTTGSVRCWGSALNGTLGYGNANDIGDNETPATAGDVILGGAATQIAAGTAFNCALLDTGAVRCWGEANGGKLGYANLNNIGDDETPASAGDVNVGGTVQQLAAGGGIVCALLTTGTVRCWGGGALFGIGYGNFDWIGDDESPAVAGDITLGGAAARIAAGGAYACAALSDGALRCWGNGADGRLGYGNTNVIGDDETPASAGNVNVGGIVEQIAPGENHTCAMLSGGAVRCWGSGAAGRLGYGNTMNIGDDEAPAAAGDVPYR